VNGTLWNVYVKEKNNIGKVKKWNIDEEPYGGNGDMFSLKKRKFTSCSFPSKDSCQSPAKEFNFSFTLREKKLFLEIYYHGSIFSFET